MYSYKVKEPVSGPEMSQEGDVAKLVIKKKFLFRGNFKRRQMESRARVDKAKVAESNSVSRDLEH